MTAIRWTPEQLDAYRVSGIYRIDDTASGRFYIGSSVDIAKRWRHHLYRFGRGDHPNPIMQAVFNENRERLVLSVVEVTTDDRVALLAAEQRHLDAAGVGLNRQCMNVLSVAGSHLGRKRSEATRAALRAASLGRRPSEEARAKMRAAKLGKPQTEEHRKNSGNARRGMKINRAKGTRQLTLRKLSDQQVVELRRMRSEGVSWRALAEHYQLNASVVKRIALRITYAEVKP